MRLPLITHVTGARPNFPKAAPVLAALRERDVRQLLVHTGQHYDDKLSEVFFRQLNLPLPDINLGVGSGSHAKQTAALMEALEVCFEENKPDLVVVYGDINSTIAAALVASKIGIPVAHVEAGLRSFDRTMPEEVNRILTDQIADLLLTTSVDAIAHLSHEGVAESKIHFVGNPMIDTLLTHRDQFDASRAREQLELPESYFVATLHRPGNVDDVEKISDLVSAMHNVADLAPIVIPLHPRGRARLEASGLLDHSSIKVIDPLGYIEFMSLVSGSSAVITDSGGVQEETTILGIPCLTVRPNTERPVTISHGTNKLVTPADLLQNAQNVLEQGRSETWPTPLLWDGRAGERIADVITNYLAEQEAAS